MMVKDEMREEEETMLVKLKNRIYSIVGLREVLKNRYLPGT